MTQDELWNTKYVEILDWVKTNHRNPSKHRIEEHNMLSWIKHNRKLKNAGKLKESRVDMFLQLMKVCEDYRHVNQYE